MLKIESLQSIEYELKQYNDNNFIEFNDEKLKELKHMV